MLGMSEEFQAAIRGASRAVFARVTIDYTDTFLDLSISISVNENANVSYPDQVADGTKDPRYKWTCLDGSWQLGREALAPPTASQGQMGWWGSSLAGNEGAFSEPYPTLTAVFFSRPIRMLIVVGDSAKGEYPVDFVVKLYQAGDVLVHTETIVDNTLVDWFLVIADHTEIVKMTLEIQRWSAADRQVKILEFISIIRETYEGDDVVLIRLLEERELFEGSLPIGNVASHEIDVVLSNRDHRFDAGNTGSPLYELLKANRRVRAWIGVELPDDTIEYAPLGMFWSGDWEAPESGLYVAATGRDRLELLRKMSYVSSQVMVDVTLYDLAASVLQDAGLAGSEYWIDLELQDFVVPYAWFAPTNYKSALREIAEACMGQVYCARDGTIRVEGPSFLAGQVDSQLVLTRDDFYPEKDHPIRWGQVVNYIEVTTQPLSPASSLLEVYRSNSAVSIAAGQTKTLNVVLNEAPCIEAAASLEDAEPSTTIIDEIHYAWGSVVQVKNFGEAPDTFVLVIDAKPLTVQNKERVTAQDPDSIVDNGVIVYAFPDNPLVQTLSVAQSIADTLVASYKDARRDITLPWRGNPALELADRITVPDFQNLSTQDYHTVSQLTEFDGGLSSTLKGRRVS